MAVEKAPPSEHTIREQAYHLWEQHGRPSGRDLEFWSRAAAMLATVKPTPSKPASAKRIAPATGAAEKPVPKRRTKSAA